MNTHKIYTAIDISSYFIKKNVSPLKLQKLLYYAQVWFFVKKKKQLFSDPISAWIFGPVVYNVWNSFKFIKRNNIIPQNKASNINLNSVTINHLNDLWNAYGHLSGSELIDLTHNEKPWLISRKGLLNDEPSTNEVLINFETVRDFKLSDDNKIPKVVISNKSFGHFGNFQILAKKGLVFLMNIKPSDEDDFLLIKKYRFIPSFTVPSKTIIELEIHKNNICIVSFYSHNKGTEKNKYKIRHNYNIGHVKAIFKACLEVFYSLGLHQYAFIFNATNDIGKNEEYNSRYSSYLRFLELYYQNYDICHKKGSTTLNTYMIYHPNYQYKKEADVFYLDFEKKIDLENQGFEIDK